MNATTTQELKDILLELNVECPKMEMSPELRAAIRDVEAFKMYLSGSSFSPETHPYTGLVEKWIEDEKEKGLIDFKPYVIPNESTTLESVSKELWGLLHAENIPDSELF